MVSAELGGGARTWSPDIRGAGGGYYQAIVEAIARDIASGLLKPGEKLPPHRELARRLTVAVGTVSKAYSEAKRRGLVRSGVGSGTFVREHPLLERRRLNPDRPDAGKIDLSFNGPIIGSVHSEALRGALARLTKTAAATWPLEYHRPWSGHDAHRRAGAAWISQFGLSVDPEDIAVVSGAQHACSVALISTTAPGDIIVTDELTDPLTKFLVGALGRHLKGLAMDEYGLLPDAFEEACQAERVKAIICSPDHHSPTLYVMPEQRRAEITRIARKFGVIVLENAVYRPFLDSAPPPLSTFAPEIAYYVTSLSKIMAPGLRVGFLAAPQGKADELVLGMGATNWMIPPLIAEIATDWIDNGTAHRLAAWQRTELTTRNSVAKEILQDFELAMLPSGLHIWLWLPHPWRATAVAQEARARGVLITPAEVFATGWMPAPHAIRISLGGAVSSQESLCEGLRVLAQILNRKVRSTLFVL